MLVHQRVFGTGFNCGTNGSCNVQCFTGHFGLLSLTHTIPSLSPWHIIAILAWSRSDRVGMCDTNKGLWSNWSCLRSSFCLPVASRGEHVWGPSQCQAKPSYVCLSIGTKRQHTHHSILHLSRSFSLYHFISLYRRLAVTAKGTHIVNICWEHVEAPSIGVTNSMSIHVIWPSQHHCQFDVRPQNNHEKYTFW